MVRQFEKYAAQVVVFLDEVGDEREDWLTHNDGVKVRQALDTLLTACGRPAGRPAGWQQACSGTAAARSSGGASTQVGGGGRRPPMRRRADRHHLHRRGDAAQAFWG